MRQFYLVNEIGSTYFFDHRNDTLISNVGDLGFSKDLTYLQYGNSYTLVNSKLSQGSLNFQVIFLKGYQGYNDFLNYIKKSNDNLRLFYKYDSSVKYCYVVLKSITKSEIESGVLQCSLTLDKLSMWLLKETYTINIDEAKNGKIYTFTYPYNYSISYSGTITVVNNGEVRAPLNIIINGSVNSPILEILQNGLVISSLHLLVKSSSCEIEINSEETNQYMVMTENDYKRNIYELQDFTCDNFLFLEKGSFQIRFYSGTTSSKTTCKITKIEGYSGH